MNTARLEHLAEIEAAIGRELRAAVRDKGHGWRVAVLATRDGEGVDARSVVLREFDPVGRRLLVFCDTRSPKVAQLSLHPQGTLVLWSPALGWQLRLGVRVEIETAGLAVSSRWARLKLTPGAQDYLSPMPPGSAQAGPPVPAPPARETRAHFAVLGAQITAIDWLELHALGHRRAVFDDRGARWVAP